MLKIKVCIHLRGGNARMAEEFLDRAQIAAGFEHVAGEGVPEHVRMDPDGRAPAPRPLPDPLLHGPSGEPRAPPADEDRRFLRRGHLVADQ